MVHINLASKFAFRVCNGQTRRMNIMFKKYHMAYMLLFNNTEIFYIFDIHSNNVLVTDMSCQLFLHVSDQHESLKCYFGH